MRTININFGQNFVSQAYQRKTQNPLVLSTLSKDTFCPSCPRFKQMVIADKEISHQSETQLAELKEHIKNLHEFFLEGKQIDPSMASGIKQTLGARTLPHAILIAASFDEKIAHKLAQPILAKYELEDIEIKILFKMIVGKTNEDIGKDLGIKIGTVGNHTNSINYKFGVNDRKEAIKIALKAIDDKFFTTDDKLSDLPQIKFNLNDTHLKILDKIAEGKSNEQIGKELGGISYKNVGDRLKYICKQLKVHDRIEIVIKALNEGIVKFSVPKEEIKTQLKEPDLNCLKEVIEGKNAKQIKEDLKMCKYEAVSRKNRIKEAFGVKTIEHAAILALVGKYFDENYINKILSSSRGHEND